MTQAKTNTQKIHINSNSGKITRLYHLIEVGDDGDELDDDIMDSLWREGMIKPKRSHSAPAGLNVDKKKEKKPKIGSKGDTKQKALDTAEKALLEFDQTKRSLSFPRSMMMQVSLEKVTKIKSTLELMLAPHLLTIYTSQYHDPAFNNHPTISIPTYPHNANLATSMQMSCAHVPGTNR